jgi:probable nitrogen fixation protein
MNTAAAAETAEDPIYTSDFAREMLRQMRAVDTYGTCDGWSDARVLEPFVLTKEQKRELPIVGDPDELTVSRIEAYYNALAALIEKECGVMASPMLKLSHEGFGRVVIIVGRLVVLDRALRDVHRFGFPSLSKMKDEADRLLSVALNIVGAHPEAARL